MTYQEFLKAAMELLADKPDHTGFKMGKGHIMRNEAGDLVGLADGDDLEDAFEVEPGDWEGDCFEGCTPAQIASALAHPQFNDFATPALEDILMTRIGEFDTGIDGRDEYFLLRCKTGDLTPRQAQNFLLPRFYRNCTRPGGYYCTAVNTVQVQYSTSEVICTVQHRYDI